MHRVYYKPGLGGEPICLEGDGIFAGYGGGLRSHSWSRSVSKRSVRGMTLGVREVDFDVFAFDDKANALRRACDADNNAKAPGIICVDDTWNTRCHIVESSTNAAYRDHVSLKLKALLVDGYWYRDKSKHFVTGLDDGGIDHPYDYPHDLSYVAGKGQLIVETRLGAKPKITFYGPVTNPYITFAGNRYEVDVQVLSGWKVVIDALDSTPTVRKVDSYGNYTSVFADAVRDGGLGGGSYAFQPIPYGTHEVTWSGAFSFDIEWREIDTEPPWNS